MSYIRHAKKIWKVEDLHGIARKQLAPIRQHITRGVSDAAESITLLTKLCDITSAKQFDPQACVIAQCMSRVLKPEAVSVGRSTIYIVQKGLAIRFRTANKKLIDEFDKNGLVIRRDISLRPCSEPIGSGKKDRKETDGVGGSRPNRKKRAIALNVRQLDGGSNASIV